jgi:hypothetical protein
LYGKQVFDYLLLPNTGKLIIQHNEESNAFKNINNSSIAPNKLQNSIESDEPLGFSINLNGMSDRFSLIDDDSIDDTGNNDSLDNLALVIEIRALYDVNLLSV